MQSFLQRSSLSLPWLENIFVTNSQNQISNSNKSHFFSTRCSKWTRSKKYVLATGIVQSLLPSAPIWEFARKHRNMAADQDIRTGDRYLTFSWQQRPSKIFVCLTISAPVLVPLTLNTKLHVDDNNLSSFLDYPYLCPSK